MLKISQKARERVQGSNPRICVSGMQEVASTGVDRILLHLQQP